MDIFIGLTLLECSNRFKTVDDCKEKVVGIQAKTLGRFTYL